MIYAAHQPNYLPWLGYFYKIMRSDVFVILDDVQLERGRGYQTRVQIKTPNGPQWMTQPVLKKGKGLQKTNEVHFSMDQNWRGKHLGQLRSNYGKASHFKSFFPRFEGWLNETEGGLAQVNTGLIKNLLEMLGCDTRIVNSSDYDVTDTGAGRIAEIGHQLGATHYLSGRGAQKYQSDEDYQAVGQKLIYTDYQMTPYEQLWGDFAPGMSILDGLFNMGIDGVRTHIQEQIPAT